MPLTRKCSFQRFLGPAVGVSQVYFTPHDGVDLRVTTIKDRSGLYVRVLERLFPKKPPSTRRGTRSLLLQQFYADGCQLIMKTTSDNTVLLDLSKNIWTTKLPV